MTQDHLTDDAVTLLRVSLVVLSVAQFLLGDGRLAMRPFKPLF